MGTDEAAVEAPPRDLRARWVLLAAVVAVGVGVDQLTKALADAYLRGRGIVVLVEGFLELRYARNPGAFFSMGADLEPTLRRAIFLGAGAIAVGLIVRLYARSGDAQKVLRWALALLLAGAIGNLIDRAVSGEVIDFVHSYWRGVFDWATYNVADVLLVAGVALLGVDLLRGERGAGAATIVAGGASS